MEPEPSPKRGTAAPRRSRACRSRCAGRSRGARGTGSSLAMLGALVVVVVVAIVAAVSSSPPPERAVTGLGRGPQRAGRAAPAARDDRLRPVEPAGRRHDRGRAGRVGRARRSSTDLLEVGSEGAAVHAEHARRPEGLASPTTAARPCCSSSSPRWCPHCAAEAPHLRALAADAAASKAAFVSVDGDGDDAASVFAYHVYFGLPYPALVDPDPARPRSPSPSTASAGRCRRPTASATYPTFYVIDPQGRIAWRGRRRAARRAAAAAARARRRRSSRAARRGPAARHPGCTVSACPGLAVRSRRREKVERPADPAVRKANTRRICPAVPPTTSSS